MKKLLLSLGALSAIVAPVAAVVACGTTTTETGKNNEGTKVTQTKATPASTKTKPAKVAPVAPKAITASVLTDAKETPVTSAPEAILTLSDEEATRIAISKATPEDIANHLTYQGRQMKYFYVITKKDGADSFDILETHNWSGNVVSYTNKLVSSDAVAGAHDLVLNPDFDITTLKPGMVIAQEDIKGQTYVTKRTSKEGIHKFFVINQDLKLDEDFSSTEDPISTGIVEALPGSAASTLDESAKVDLHKIDAGKALAQEMTTGLIGRSKVTVIKANWDILEDSVSTVKDFIERVAKLAYPGNPSQSVRANIKTWVEKVISGAQKDTDATGAVVTTVVTKGILEGYDVDVALGDDILKHLISKHKLDGIRNNWAELTKMTDKDELIGKIGTLSYGDALNSQELEHIGKWIANILATTPTGPATPVATTVPETAAPATATTNTDASAIVTTKDIDLSDKDIDTILGKPYTLNLISSKKTQAIKDGWATVVATAKTLQDLADQVTQLAYPGTTDTKIKTKVLTWAKRVLGQEPLAVIVQSPWAYVPYKG